MQTTNALTIQPLQQPATPKASAPARKVTGRTKTAIDLMVWDGMTDNQAAVQTGLTVTAIRIALKQAHVRSYYHSQLQVLRERESSRNIHTLMEVRDQKTNQMARVAAVKAMREQENDAQAAGQTAMTPGFNINIVTNVVAPLAARTTIDATALPERGLPNDINE